MTGPEYPGQPDPSGFQDWWASEEEPAPVEPVPSVLSDCWRCGKGVEPDRPLCPYCRARISSSPEPLHRAGKPSDDSPESKALLGVLYVFIIFLGTSLIYGWLVQFGFSGRADNDREAARQQLYFMLAVEFFDTLLVVGSILAIMRPTALPAPSAAARSAAWAGAIPLLLLLLGLNYAYHFLLRKILAFPPCFDEAVIKSELSGLSVLAVCIQPAIVEELFFRYLALGTLRRSMGIHAAVLVSSVMFGIAHIGVPLSIPMLTLIGVGLGYARVVSGSLWLPILLHFFHNGAILLYEYWS